MEVGGRGVTVGGTSAVDVAGCTAVAGTGVALGAAFADAQEVEPTGLEVGALPAINFDSDEGFGYGALAQIYDYGDGGLRPYAWTLQPTVFLTTHYAINELARVAKLFGHLFAHPCRQDIEPPVIQKMRV